MPFHDGVNVSIILVDGIYVSKAKYRTHPIQIFIYPNLSIDDQILLMKYFNLLLEQFREMEDSEFLTTYKYSNSEYIRKYLGLSQTRKLLQTFPYPNLERYRNQIKQIISDNDGQSLIQLIKNINSQKNIDN